MTVEPAPLELLLSKRAAGFLRVNPVRSFTEPAPRLFLSQWRVDPADDGDGGRWFMVTNLPTLFTFLLPRRDAGCFNALVQQFRLRLGFALLAASPPLEWTPSEIVPVRGNPRPVVGSMNNMAQLLAWPHRPDPMSPYGDAEGRLQHTPFSAAGGKGRWGFPYKVWQQYLDALAHSRPPG